MTRSSDEIVETVKRAVKEYPNFPKSGIHFYDMFPILRHPDLVREVVSEIVRLIKSRHQGEQPLHAIVGLEARGFLLGPMIALELGVAFYPIRKKGKLPGRVKSISYEKEYGVDVIEIAEFDNQADCETRNVILFDDLLATGGTAKAAIQLLQQEGLRVCEAFFLFELDSLSGRKVLNTPVHSLIHYP